MRLTRLLLRSDVCLMSQSIEGRVPFLHNDLPSLAMAIPWSETACSPGKTPLRQAYAGALGERTARSKVRFKSSDAMLLRCLSQSRLRERIVVHAGRALGRERVESALALMHDPQSFDADVLCLLMSLTFLFENGMLDDHPVH